MNRRVWGDVSIMVTRWDGSQTRLAGDELDARNVPCDLTYSTSMPGGFRAATCTLFRELQTPGAEGLFDTFRVLGPGGRIYWEGRLQSIAASTADGGRATPSAVGWSAHLEDRQDVGPVYVDRELGQWGPITSQRRQQILGYPYRPIDGTTGWDDSDAGAGPEIRLWHGPGESPWTVAGRPVHEIRYDGGGATLDAVEARVAAAVGTAGWDLAVRGWDRRQTAWSSVGIWSHTVGARVSSSIAPARAAAIGFSTDIAPGGSVSGQHGVALAEVAVYGDLSGVTTVRTDSPIYGPGQGPLGVTASSVIRDAISRWAPQIRVDDESVQPTTYPIPHLAPRELGTVASLTELVNRHHWWDWAVWEDRRFWYHQRFGGRSRSWIVSTQDGAELSLEGDTTDLVFNGVIVEWTDFGGEPHTVGPPGSSAEFIDGRLASPDPYNPATLHGIQRWGVFRLSAAADREGAVLCGLGWLDAQSIATRRGTATVTGSVLDTAGHEHPVDMIRAGDRLYVAEETNPVPRRIIETNMVHATRQNTLTLDNTAQTLEALLERMGVSLIGVL